jgi:hypothetical protein
MRIIHHRNIHSDALKAYSRLAARLVVFVLRCHQGWDCEYSMELTVAQHEASQALLDALDTSDTISDPSGLDETLFDVTQPEDLDEDYEVALDPDDEDHEMAVDDPVEDISPLSSNHDEPVVSAANPIQERLLDVLLSLYTHLPTERDDKFYSPIFRFIILYSLRKGGMWIPARQITHVISALLFSGRLLMMVLMHREVVQGPNVRYAQYVTSLPAFLRAWTLTADDRAYGVVAPYLDDEREAPIPNMYLLVRPLNQFASLEQGPLQFTALNFDGDNVIVDGKVLYLYHLREFVETLICEIKDHLKKQLFFDLDIVDTSWSPQLIYDEPRNTQVSYSAYDDPRNTFHLHKDTLLKAILTDPRLKGRFHYRDSHNRIVWKAGPCFAFMDIAHQVEMKLFVASHITVGETGRGTEIAAHLIRNKAGGNIRNILHMFQHLIMLGTYNKSTRITDSGPIVRVPLPEVGRLWTIFHTFVRPLLVVWQDYFHGPHAAARFHYCLFGGPYRPVTSSELSLYLSKTSFRLLGIKIPISLWRHIQAWFMNHNATRFEASLSQNSKAVMAAKMGHSQQIHSLYASDGRLPGNVDFHAFFQMMVTSAVWHHLLGFSPDLLDAMTITLHPSTILQRSNLNFSDTQPLLPISRSPSLSINSLTDQIATLLIADIPSLSSKSFTQDLVDFVDATGLQIRNDLSSFQPGTDIFNYTTHPSRLLHLRTFMNDDLATFKGCHQALTTELLASRSCNLLLISSTGNKLISYKESPIDLQNFHRFWQVIASFSLHCSL